MTYNKEYYEKNKEKLLEYQKKKQRERRKKINTSLRLRALKSWRTRIEQGYLDGIEKNISLRLKELNKEIKDLEKVNGK